MRGSAAATAIRVDVRVVAATNQDLEHMVRESAGSEVKPVLQAEGLPDRALPPLRERLEDIPALVRHFAAKFASRMNKELSRVPDEMIEVLRLHDWPGNIRELQNFIERAVIMSSGPDLRLPFGELKHLIKSDTPSAIRSLAEAERDHIVETLRQVGWVVGGRDGAAARLGVARTTLLYRMRKLGIGQGKASAASAASLA